MPSPQLRCSRESRTPSRDSETSFGRRLSLPGSLPAILSGHCVVPEPAADAHEHQPAAMGSRNCAVSRSGASRRNPRHVDSLGRRRDDGGSPCPSPRADRRYAAWRGEIQALASPREPFLSQSGRCGRGLSRGRFRVDRSSGCPCGSRSHNLQSRRIAHHPARRRAIYRPDTTGLIIPALESSCPPVG